MSYRQRPGGLTALAVINFVFGGFNVLSLGGSALFLANREEFKREIAQGGGTVPPDWFFVYELFAKAVLAGLLISSAIGYLKLRKRLGRDLGNLYAVTSIADTVVRIAVGGDFSMFFLLLAVYPLLTLVMLNLIFKDDFE